MPGESGSNGLKIANALEQQGAHVIGWDLEWNMNFNVNRCTRLTGWPICFGKEIC